MRAGASGALVLPQVHPPESPRFRARLPDVASRRRYQSPHRPGRRARARGIRAAPAARRAARRCVDLPQVREALIVSTCNRTELYCVTEPGHGDVDLGGWLERYHALGAGIAPRSSVTGSMRARRRAHVCGGSRDSTRWCSASRRSSASSRMPTARRRRPAATGPVLNRLFQAAFSVAKRVRTETQIGANAVSVASAAVR